MTALKTISEYQKRGWSVTSRSRGRIRIEKPGFLPMDVIDVCGVAAVVIDPDSRNPAQISTEHWI